MIDRAHMILRRYALGMTQRQLAEAIGKSQSAVGSWEAGSNEPLVRDIPKLCAALKTEPNKIIRGWE